MTERFQVTIVGPAPAPAIEAPDSPFQLRQHARGGAVVDRIDDLARIWDQVISKLTSLANSLGFDPTKSLVG